MTVRQAMVAEEDIKEREEELGEVSEEEETGDDVYGGENRDQRKGMVRKEVKKVKEHQVLYHVLLVTCAVTRAVHLEVLRTMETKEILWALRRFVAVRGKPENIISDNSNCWGRLLERWWVLMVLSAELPLMNI
eukprot:GHVQ01001555.1.p2 GENE.GHVQ01001555.1~~GHVQ01001555.1.p2  ORF type:complete len:134 (-),score=19.58 GHVQ01001555.1:878-1279(-)